MRNWALERGSFYMWNLNGQNGVYTTWFLKHLRTRFGDVFTTPLGGWIVYSLLSGFCGWARKPRNGQGWHQRRAHDDVWYKSNDWYFTSMLITSLESHMNVIHRNPSLPSSVNAAALRAEIIARCYCMRQCMPPKCLLVRNGQKYSSAKSGALLTSKRTCVEFRSELSWL